MKRTLIALAVVVATLLAVVVTPTRHRPALAGTPPNILDDNRPNSALAALADGLISPLLDFAPAGLSAIIQLPPGPVLIGAPPFPSPSSGRALGHPHIVNLYYSSDWDANRGSAPTKGQIQAFTADLVASTYFNRAGPYGVGSASFDSTIFEDNGASNTFCGAFVHSTTDFVTLLQWVSCEVGFGRFFDPTDHTFTGVPGPDSNSLYVVYLPPGVDFAGSDCSSFAGYHFFSAAPAHNFFIPFAQSFPFAVIPARCAADFDALMGSASHEIIEASTDPINWLGWINNLPVTSSDFSDLFGSSGPFNGLVLDAKVGEAADICAEVANPITGPPAFQHPTQLVRRDVADPALGNGGHILVAPYWSNADNACVPFAGSISGFKFEDLNGDGAREPGEPGLGGWTIQLRGPANVDAVTDANGAYSFTGLPLGNYQLSEVPQPPVWTQSYPPGNKSAVVIAESALAHPGVNFGNFRQALITGIKFLDVNGNSVQDPGDTPIPGWGINLGGTDGLGNPVSLSTTTDGSGNYKFVVNPGTYTVSEKVPPGWVQTAPQPVPPGDYVLTVQSGDVREGLNFGNAKFGSAAGLKWRDQNANGVQDPGEPVLSGWEIHLDGQSGKSAPVHRVTVTDANGKYSFASLPPGNYTVSEVLQPGWRQTFPRGDGTYPITITSGLNLTSLDFGNLIPIVKAPRLANLWLCQPVATCTNVSGGVGERDFTVVLPKAVASVSPKGEPQTVGSFQFEVRFDRKLVNVTVDPGSLFLVGSILRSDVTCASTSGQGFVQFRCNVKGKTGTPIIGPGALAVVHVTPTADVYSMVIPSQDNGIATQLINQGCDLGDLQGHPIKTDTCDNAEVTLRYLEGDVNADCVVDVRDQQEIAFRWGSHTGQLLYNSRFDLEPAAPKLGDGDIDAKDLQVVFGRHGSTCAAPHPPQPPADPKALPPAPTPPSPPV